MRKLCEKDVYLTHLINCTPILKTRAAWPTFTGMRDRNSMVFYLHPYQRGTKFPQFLIVSNSDGKKEKNSGIQNFMQHRIKIE